MQFSATIQLDGKTATGIRVPENVISSLGGGNRPQVRVTLAGYSYQTTVARMRGEFMFPVSAAVRDHAGVAAGDHVVVEIDLDTTPRELTLPTVLAEALQKHPGAHEAFQKLSYTNRKRHALAIESAKTAETQQRRITKMLEELATQQ